MARIDDLKAENKADEVRLKFVDGCAKVISGLILAGYLLVITSPWAARRFAGGNVEGFVQNNLVAILAIGACCMLPIPLIVLWPVSVLKNRIKVRKEEIERLSP